MNISIQIAKAELRSLFYSPIAWFLTIVFIFQSGLSFTSNLEDALTKQQLGGNYLLQLGHLTDKMFGYFGLFGDIGRKIFLYLPLITMGLISRETSSGTIKLLYSSPITIRQIISGKFLAMVTYSFLLVAILSLYLLIGANVIKSADTGAMLTGLIGIFLLLATYSAIGLFMSCLTGYQVVAALSTLVIFGVLNYIGTVWQNIGFVRDLTYFLSMAGRTDRMTNGLISSKDVAYFLVIILMFLTFSVIKLQGERKSSSLLKNAVLYTLTFVFFILLGTLTSVPRFIVSYDASAGKRFTLHDNTKKIISALNDGPLEVTTYINLLDQYIWEGLPNVRNRDLDRWEPYLRAKHDVRLKYVYYYDYPGQEQQLMSSNPGKTLKQLAETAARTHHFDLEDFLTPEQIKKVVDLRSENNSYVMQLKYKGKFTFLRLYNDQLIFPSETEVAAGLKRLTDKLPKIVFVESEQERGRNFRGDRDYGILANGIKIRESLINQGFDTESISLLSQEVPENTTALVVADPKIAFTDKSLEKLQRFIDKGGNLLITSGPGRQEIINPLLAKIGVKLSPGQLVQDDNLLRKGNQDPSIGAASMGTVGTAEMRNGGAAQDGLTPDIIKPFLTREAAKKSRYFKDIFADSIPMVMKGTSVLSYISDAGFSIFPFAQSDEKVSWLKKDQLNADSLHASFNSAVGDVKGSFPVALALERQINNKPQRIFVSGNSDFLSNSGLQSNLVERQANPFIGIGIFNWFSDNRYPIDTAHPAMRDNGLNLTTFGLKVIKIAFLGLLPGLLLIAGTIFLLRRKRR